MNKLRNLLGERDLEIKQLKNEIKGLQNVQRRQARAIKEMDDMNEFIPKHFASLGDENAYLKVRMIIMYSYASKDKISKMSQQQSRDTNTIIQQNEMIDKMKEKLSRLEIDGSPTASSGPDTADAAKLQEEIENKVKNIEVSGTQ